MKTHLRLALAASLVAVASAAMAANKAETYSVSPVVGGITFEGKQHLETAPFFGVRAGYNFTKEWGVEGLFDYAHTKATVGSGAGVDFFRYGGELLYHFFPDNQLVPYLAAGFSGITFDGPLPLGGTKWSKGSFDYGLGAKYFLTENVALRADVRHLVYQNVRTQQAVEYSAGLYIPFGGTKPAAKPVEPPPAPAAAPAPVPAPAPVVTPPPAPAPAPPVAPSANLTVSPASITKGQPAVLNWTSANATNCNIQPGIGPVGTQGTVNVTPGENTNYTLTCLGAGGSATSTAAVAVTVSALVEAAQPKASAAKLCSPTVLNVQFDTNKYDIKPEFHDELKKVGDFLQEFPEAKGVIEGHTDSVGNMASNMKLSQRRAESVRDYLIKTFNIAPERIAAKGYGPTKSVADNKTKLGKQKNRRIEANFDCNGK